MHTHELVVYNEMATDSYDCIVSILQILVPTSSERQLVELHRYKYSIMRQLSTWKKVCKRSAQLKKQTCLQKLSSEGEVKCFNPLMIDDAKMKLIVHVYAQSIADFYITLLRETSLSIQDLKSTDALLAIFYLAKSMFRVKDFVIFNKDVFLLNLLPQANYLCKFQHINSNIFTHAKTTLHARIVQAIEGGKDARVFKFPAPHITHLLHTIV